MMTRSALVSMTAILFLLSRSVGSEADASRNVSPDKQTVLGLYLTAPEAYERWKADPERVKIIDVRTPEEYVFVGHPVMARNIPFSFMANEWDAAKKNVVMKPNPNFIDQVKQVLKAGDLLLVTCRSGQRSAPAVDALAEAGFENVYSIIDGVEGDRVRDPESVFNGQRMRNGWKNAGLPWTYDLDPELMYLQQ
jgi:rhodanese-related sulfurtransferase